MKIATTLLVVCVGALLSLGLVVLYSAGMSATAAKEGARYLLMQLVWCSVGLVACLVAAWMDYRRLRMVAWVLLGLSVVMLILVLVPGIGVARKGARLVRSRNGQLQPSEAATSSRWSSPWRTMPRSASF